MHLNPHTTSLHVTGAALASLLSACAPTPPVPTADVTPVTDTPTFHYRPGTSSYLSTTHRVVERVVGERARVDSINLEYQVTTEIAGEDPSTTVRFAVDTVLHATARNILPSHIARASGASFRARMLPSGRVEGLEEPDPDSPLLGMLVRELSSFFPIVPSDGASPHATWVDTAETQRRQEGAVLTIRSITTYRSGGWNQGELEGDAPVLEVEWERQYRVEGTGEQFGRTFTVRGEGTTTGRTRLSADGRYLGTVRQDDLRAELTDEMEGMVSPVRQHQIDTTRVLR